MLPLDDRRVERFNADLAGRPQLVKGNRQLLFGGMGRLTENSVVDMKNKSHAVTAEIVVPDGGAEGVIVAQGGAFGGWSLYRKDGRPTYCYNLFGLQRFNVDGDDRAPAGRAPGADGVRLRRRRPRQGRHGRRSTSTASKVGEGRVDATVPMLFSADETPDVGSDSGTPVTRRLLRRDSALHRPVRWVADRPRRRRRRRRPPDHPGGTPRVAMARQ